MELIDINKPSGGNGLVATIGFFDGVHLGHRFLIEQAKVEAARKGLPSAVITFPVHPRKVLSAEYRPALLCGYEEKLEQLSTTGIDYCCPVDFTKELSAMSAKEFMQKVLKDKLNVEALIIGYDHRFGHNREDGFDEYKAYGKELGIDVILAQELDSMATVSSSAIRSLLAEGNVEKANELLSYTYTIRGKIVEGFKVGRTIGFPTANVQIWERYKVVPALGIYAARVCVEGNRYDAMLYIGNRPTLQNGDNISIEINLFDFDGDLYNKELKAEFLVFIRHDKKFDSLEELKVSITQDKESVKDVLKKIVDKTNCAK